MGFSIKPTGIKAIKDQKQAQRMFRGDSVRLLYVCLKKDFQAAQENVQALLKLPPNWKTVDFVILDNLNREFYEEGPKIAKEVLINAESVWKGDGNVPSHGMKTAWVPWIVPITHFSSISAKPADLRQLSLFCTGQDPDQRLFTEPKMSPTLMEIQAHVLWSEQLITHLGGTRARLDETPGSVPKYTKVYCKDMTSSDLNALVDKFGNMPRFALMTSAMFEGRILEKMPHVFNVYVTASRRTEVAPYMFGFPLSQLWSEGKIFSDNDVFIHDASYTKLRVGCSAEGKQVFMACVQPLTDLGLSVKDETTNEPITPEDAESDVFSTQSEWGSVETCMILGVPQFWKEAHLRAVLETVGDTDFLLNKLPWNVGPIRTSTWRVQAPKASTWVGKVFRSKEGRVLMVISAAEYRERRQKRLTAKPASKKAAVQEAQPNAVSPSPAEPVTSTATAARFQFKRAKIGAYPRRRGSFP